MLKNTNHSYGSMAMIMHWLMAVVIFAMFGLGYWMTGLSYYDHWYHAAPEIHKAVGMLLLGVLLFRTGWRWLNVRPALAGKVWEQMAALSVHRLHYVLMFSVMISGYLIPTAEGVGIDIFGWFTVPAMLMLDKQQADLIGEIHWFSAWVLMGLAALHAVAALKHHWIDHDATLLSMLGVSVNRH